MGNCGGKDTSKQKLQKQKSVILTKQEALAQQMQTTVTFKVQLQNIKIKNLPVDNYSIVYYVGNIENHLQEIKGSGNPHWKVKKELDFTVNTSDLDKKEFILIVKNKSQEIARIELNIFKIITGPIHHDMLLNVQGQTDSRITFLLTMAQQVRMKLLVKEVTFELNDEGLKYERHKDPLPQAYNFTMKVKSHNHDYESDHSYNFMNKYNDYFGNNNQLKSQSNLHEDQDNFFSQQNSENQNNMLSQSQNRINFLNQQRLSKKYSNSNIPQLNKLESFKLNNFNAKNNELSHYEEEEFPYKDIGEITKNVNIPNSQKTGTIQRVNQTILTLQQIKQEKGKLYRINSKRQSNVSFIQDFQAQHLQNEIQSGQLKHSQSKQLQKRSSTHQQHFMTANQLSRNQIGQGNPNNSNNFKTTSLLPRQLSNKIIQSYDEVLDWQKIQQYKFRMGDEDTPSVIFEIYADEFASSTFYLKLWSTTDCEMDPFQKQNNNNTIKEQKSIKKVADNKSFDQDDDFSSDTQVSQYIDHETTCHAEISMNRFCSEDVDNVNANFETNFCLVEHHLKDLKLWHHGKNVGVCFGEFVTNYTPFFRQMYGGVRTESGITKATRIYLQKKNVQDDNTKIPIEFKQILNRNDVIEGSMEKLNDNTLTYRQRMQINKEIKTNLVKIMDLLKVHSFQDTDQLFKNEEQLIDAQQILINVAKHLLVYADQVDEVLRDQYFECLIEIINREELGLSHMGFEHDFHDIMSQQNVIDLRKLKNIYKKKGMDIIYKKISIGLTYQNFLYQTLDKVLHKLEQHGLNEKERQFVENFCSLAYFRIPQFREHLLEAISQKHINAGITIPEWDDINEDKYKNDVKYQIFISLFSWDKDFYSYLKTQARYEEHIVQLNQILDKTKWKQRFQKTGVAFNQFLIGWCNYVQKNVSHASNMPWEILPGYNILMKSFLYELKTRDTEAFPDSLKEASNMLLYSNNHLKPFLYIIYNKTNVYIARQVFYCYDMLNLWFQRIILIGSKIPTNFDYNFFFKGIDIVFDPQNNEHGISIAKALLVLYNNYQLFPDVKKQEYITKYFFTNMFFFFFTHWSKTVRNIYQYFLLFRIYHYHRKQTLSQNTKEDFKMQRQLLEKNLKQNQNQTNQEDMDSETFNLYMVSEYNRVIQVARKSKKKIEQHLFNKNPIETQLKNNSLKVKLLGFKEKLQRQKIMSLQKRKESQKSNQSETTPTKDNIIKPSSLLNTPSRQSQGNKYDEIDDNEQFQSLILNNEEHLNISAHSMGAPQVNMKIDIDDISQQGKYESRNTITEDSYFEDQSVIDKLDFDIQQFQDTNNAQQKKKIRKGSQDSNNLRFARQQYNSEAIRQKQSSTSPVNHQQNDLIRKSQEIVRKLSIDNIKARKTNASQNKNVKNKVQQGKTKKKIYQGNFHKDRNSKKLEVPKKCYKTLVIAYQEFEQLKKEYEKWYIQQQNQINAQTNSSEQEKLLQLKEAQILDIPLKIHKDETESKVYQYDNEW